MGTTGGPSRTFTLTLGGRDGRGESRVFGDKGWGLLRPMSLLPPKLRRVWPSLCFVNYLLFFVLFLSFFVCVCVSYLLLN